MPSDSKYQLSALFPACPSTTFQHNVHWGETSRRFLWPVFPSKPPPPLFGLSSFYISLVWLADMTLAPFSSPLLFLVVYPLLPWGNEIGNLALQERVSKGIKTQTKEKMYQNIFKCSIYCTTNISAHAHMFLFLLLLRAVPSKANSPLALWQQLSLPSRIFCLSCHPSLCGIRLFLWECRLQHVGSGITHLNMTRLDPKGFPSYATISLIIRANLSEASYYTTSPFPWLPLSI